MESPCILIPAYKPDHKMIDLIETLLAAQLTNIIVVDDGGGTTYADLFRQAGALGCTVLHHMINMGKGRALKTGINYGLEHHRADHGIITADADGQHTPADILRIAAAMAETPEALVLGVRHFSGQIPLRSRLGNNITRSVFASINGEDIQDTQTGLRGLPCQYLPLFLSLGGERYEFEMNMLLAIRPNEIKVVQIPIETVYLQNNESSHFNPFLDSLRIYRLMFKFIFSSAFAFLVDFTLFVLMSLALPNQLLASVITARAGSSFVNYLINRHLVFKHKGDSKKALVRYYILVVFIMLASYGLIKLLHEVLGLNRYVAKVLADGVLYIASFFFQREFVYRK